MASKTKLTAKQQRFVDEYLIDLNATQAAIRAGYSAHTASVIASQHLRKLHISEAIQAGKQLRAVGSKVDADYVLKRLIEIDELDIADILDDRGRFLPIKEWSKAWRCTLSAIDSQELLGDAAGVIRKIKWPDKCKNLELMGRHIGVGAWRDTPQMPASITLTVNRPNGG